MTFTYTLAAVKDEALHWVRWRVGDTLAAKSLAADEEIEAALLDQGLATTSDPQEHAERVRRAAAAVCYAIAAKLSRDAQLATDGIGTVKSTAAGEYRRRAEELLSEADQIARGGLGDAEQSRPHEEIDSAAWAISLYGRDTSEYVGDLE